MMHYKHISEELCENKAKPELNCNGKCHLKIELAKASKDNNLATTDCKNIPKLELLFIEPFPVFSFYVNLLENVKILNFYNQLYFHRYLQKIFQPPIF